MAKVIFHLSIYVFFMCLCVRVCAVFPSSSLVFSLRPSIDLSLPFSFHSFFFHFPSFPQRTTHLIHRDRYTPHTLAFRHSNKHPCRGARTHTHSKELLVFSYGRLFALLKEENIFFWKAWSIIAAQCWDIAPLLALFSLWFITLKTFSQSEI